MKKEIKIKITKNKKNLHDVKVANIGEKDYLNPDLVILSGEEKTVLTGIAKHYFGDWENDTWGELKRRESLNIHLIDVSFEEVEIEEKKEEVNDEPSFLKKAAEKEFEDLNPTELDMTSKTEEPVKICQGVTKSGKPCKAKATNGDYCGNHYK